MNGIHVRNYRASGAFYQFRHHNPCKLTAIEALEPARGALKPVRRRHVVHEHPVEVQRARGFINARCKQFAVLGLSATVAADVEVVARFGGNETKVFGLSLGALARAA